MRFFKDAEETNKEMTTLKEILDDKGYALKSDHPYVYYTQYAQACSDIEKWMYDHDYEGNIDEVGTTYISIAGYAIYDTSKLSYEQIMTLLDDELKKEWNQE